MSREARKLLTDLEAIASKYNITTLVTPSQVYVADQLIQKYYTAPILNAIKSKVKSLKNRSSKHFTVEHWVSVLDSIFVGNSGVRREGSVVQVIDGHDIGLQGFQLLIRYLPTDYSINDAEMIYNIVHRYTNESIQSAIRTANVNKVYNIQYVNAILEREQALSNIRKQEIDKLRERANSSNSVLNRTKVEHSAIDMAISQYNWEQAKSNSELEQKMKEMFGE
jgi:hypothetical protein